MILTCPACASSYFIEDAKLGEKGRTVRCASCRHTWHAMPEPEAKLEDSGDDAMGLDDMDMEMAMLGDDPTKEMNQDDLDSLFGDDMGGGSDADSLTDMAAASDPAPTPAAPEPAPVAAQTADEADLMPKAAKKAEGHPVREQMEGDRRRKTMMAVTLTWGALAATFALVIASAALFRVQLVKLIPAVAGAYAAVGVEVNPVGLRFESYTAEPDFSGGRFGIRVRAVLRNERDEEVEISPIKATVLDDKGRMLTESIEKLSGSAEAKGTTTVTFFVSDPLNLASNVDLAFADEEEVKAKEKEEKLKAHIKARQEGAKGEKAGGAKSAEAGHEGAASVKSEPGGSAHGAGATLSHADAGPGAHEGAHDGAHDGGKSAATAGSEAAKAKADSAELRGAHH